MNASVERVVIACLVALIFAMEVWNTHRTNEIIVESQARMTLRWRSDDMEKWIGENQARFDEWCQIHKLSTYRLPGTNMR